MKLHAIIRNSCLVTAAVSLGTGYILGGYMLIVPVFLAMAIFWITMRRKRAFAAASSLLSISVLIAAIGMTLNLSTHLMILGCTAALVWWDLVHFITDTPPVETKVPLERYRLQSLAMAAFAGLFLALISSYIELQFPFGIMILLVLMAMGCLVYGIQYVIRNR